MHEIWHSITETSRKVGYDYFEIFAEKENRLQATISSKLTAFETSASQGFSARAKKGKESREYFSSEPKLADIERMFEISISKPEEFSLGFSGTTLTESTLKKWESLTREFWQSLKGISHHRSLFKFSNREFFVQNFLRDLTFGEETSISLNLDWEIDGKNYSHSLFWLSLEKMEYDLAKKLPQMRKIIERSQKKTKPWPVPQGTISLFFEPEALAPIVMALSRMFEADSFLMEKSFLQGADVFPPTFSLKDSPLQKRYAYDCEGFPKKPFTLIERGQARGLACNVNYAQEMGVLPTGHSRRMDFEKKPVPLFSHLKAKFGGNAPPPASSKQGISIEDLKISNFDALSLEVSFQTLECRIVHQGEKGERLENFSLTLKVSDLFNSVTCSSENVKTIGFLLSKNGQDFIVEIECPEITCQGISIPGSVPASHYW